MALRTRPLVSFWRRENAIRDWAREEVTANLCPDCIGAVAQGKLGNFLAQLADRTEEVKQRCRTVLQA